MEVTVSPEVRRRAHRARTRRPADGRLPGITGSGWVEGWGVAGWGVDDWGVEVWGAEDWGIEGCGVEGWG
ncbi:hypothetical protein GCM10009832_10070 [Dietzia kunjamensis subsp. schimae]